MRSRRSFKLGAKAREVPVMPLLPGRSVRTGAYCSTTDDQHNIFVDRPDRTALQLKLTGLLGIAPGVLWNGPRRTTEGGTVAVPPALTLRLPSRSSRPRRSRWGQLARR